MKITGVSLADADLLAARFTAAVGRELHATMRWLTSRWKSMNVVSVDDLAPISMRWANRVDKVLLPQMAQAYWHGVDETARPIIVKLAADHAAQTAAAPPPPEDAVPVVTHNLSGDPGFPADLAAYGVTIARVSNPQAEQHMANARNRLVAVSDEVWEHARDQLLEGQKLGEGVDKLATRVATIAASLAQPRAEVIARTEIHYAVERGSIDQIKALAVPADKTWIATHDGRTRPAHLDADGQTVAVTDSYDVDGEALDHPGDGSAANSINCRCTESFSIPEDQVEAEYGDAAVASAHPYLGERIRGYLPPGRGQRTVITAAAGDEPHTGAMLALVPTDADLQRLVLPDGEMLTELHLTLFFLGDAADYSEEQQRSVAVNVLSLFDGFGLLPGNAFGVDYWNPGSDTPAWVLQVGDDPANLGGLHDAKSVAEAALNAAGVSSMVPDQHCPWSPHICLAYSPDLTLINDMVKRVGPITFDRVRVAFADTYIDLPLAD